MKKEKPLITYKTKKEIKTAFDDLKVLAVKKELFLINRTENKIEISEPKIGGLWIIYFDRNNYIKKILFY